MSEVVVIEETKAVAKQQVTPMALIEVAMQQNADVDKLEKLWELQQRYEAAEAKKAFVAAMAKFRENCPSIVKTKKAHNSKYAGLAETISQIKGVESECGLSHSWRTDSKNKTVEVTCIVTHELGHSEQTTLFAEPDKSGSKNSIQAIGSSVTYLQRYTLFSLLGLASIEDDLDGGEIPFNGDVTLAIQEASSKEVLRSIWNSLSDKQKAEHREDIDLRLEELPNA